MDYFLMRTMFRIFFFQAKDGIRDIGVTVVQTCALPIYTVTEVQAVEIRHGSGTFWGVQYHPELDLYEVAGALRRQSDELVSEGNATSPEALEKYASLRSEERRVGKECRSRWSPYH